MGEEKRYQDIETILSKAGKLIYGERAQSYGPVSENWVRIAKMWSVIADADITVEQALMMMAAMKISRELHQPKEDNIVDAAGYLALIEKYHNEIRGQMEDITSAGRK